MGSVLSLETAWQLAQAWYRDRLDPGWRRKPLAETQRLFASLGMVGPFWQLKGQREKGAKS